ncbi:MAG: thiamine diphosphokinase [Ruminococcaceae bacterium]|nr:thiamine diphosphokinase [Oscillospiraceae bacterium]
MKAFIYTGGIINTQNITEHPKGDDLVIAADSGYDNAKALGEKPNILLGDMDSIKSKSLPEDIETLKVPAEKDFTDTQLAVDTAIKRGAREIVIIGGLDGRLDHTLSNLAILEDLYKRGIFAHITNGYNRVRFLNSTSTLLPKSGFGYFGLLCFSEKAKGVSIEGAKYPLKNAKIERTFQFAVSNEIVGNCALISVRKGAFYIVESSEQIK